MIKKLFFITLLTSLSVSVLLTGCESTSNVPAYALGEGNYFSYPESGYSAVYGKIDTISQIEYMGNDKYDRLAKIVGYEAKMNGQKFYLIFKEKHRGYDRSHWLFSDKSLSIHALVTQNTGKKYDMDEKLSYSDSYYFVDDEELAKAIKKFNSATKTKNNPSQYNVKDYAEMKGCKTYHANIISTVEYRGKIDSYDERFLSLYLSCGVVVQLRTDKEIGSPYDDSLVYRIDCITDENNNVFAYEIN